MTDLLQVENLVVGNRYKVFLVAATQTLNLDSGKRMEVATGKFIKKTKDGEAIFARDEKDEKGKPIVGYYGTGYRFKDDTAAGHGFRAVRALKGRGRRRTRRHGLNPHAEPYAPNPQAAAEARLAAAAARLAAVRADRAAARAAAEADADAARLLHEATSAHHLEQLNPHAEPYKPPVLSEKQEEEDLLKEATSAHLTGKGRRRTRKHKRRARKTRRSVY